MVPVTAPAVIVGGTLTGFTVMVNFAGTPGQPLEGAIKLPNEIGVDPFGLALSLHNATGDYELMLEVLRLRMNRCP